MALDLTYSVRIDSGSGADPSIRLSNDPAFEVSFLAETSTGGSGDLLLDITGTATPDPDTQVVINGVSYEFTYEISGTLPSAGDKAAKKIPTELQGEEVAVITVYDYPAPGDETRIVFAPDADVSLAVMDDWGKGNLKAETLTPATEPAAICFLVSSKLDTPKGPRPVERLKVGDLVNTADHGPMPIQWIGFTDHDWPGTHEDFKPIMIKQGAFGAGRPRRDLIVSPQHRIVLSGAIVQELFGEREVFVAAKFLTSLPRVRCMKGKKSARYYHVLLDTHAVISAHNMPTESFYPGPMALSMMRPDAREEIEYLLPGVQEDLLGVYGPTARRSLKRKEADILVPLIKSNKGRRRLNFVEIARPDPASLRHLIPALG